MTPEVKLPEPGACEDCLTVVAYLRATKDGVPIWGENCVCQNPVYPSDPDGSDADSISLPLVRLSDAQLLAAEVERLRMDAERLNAFGSLSMAQERWVVAVGDEGYTVYFSKGCFATAPTIREAIDAALDASRLAPKEKA